jgi:hypothetical protein
MELNRHTTRNTKGINHLIESSDSLKATNALLEKSDFSVHTWYSRYAHECTLMQVRLKAAGDWEFATQEVFSKRQQKMKRGLVKPDWIVNWLEQPVL